MEGLARSKTQKEVIIKRRVHSDAPEGGASLAGVNMIIMMRILLLIAFINMVQYKCALAYCEDPPAKLCNMLFSEDVVIHAKVVKTEIFKDKDDPDGVAGWLYYMKVLKSYRGTTAKTVIVKSENSTSRLLLKLGLEYIVFASRFPDGHFEAGNYCGGIQGIDGEPYSMELEAQIQNLLKSSGPSFIEGEVRNKKFEFTSGAALTVTGTDFSKQIIVDKHGLFRLQVPPGTYKITLPKNLEVTIYSPDGHNRDPHSDEIPPQSLVAGQCMQLQLQEKRER